MREALYLTLGILALDDAAGRGTESAFDVLRRVPGGRAIAVLGAVGLICFALFQIADGVLNLDERHGRLREWASRIGRLGTGGAYAVIAIIGGKLALFGGDAGSSEAGAQASRHAIHGFGGVLVTIFGLGFAIGAIDQVAKAVTASFRKQLRPETPRLAIVLGRAVFAGHAAIIAMLAWLIVRAGLTEHAQPFGMGPAIDDLRRMGWVYQAVALSLIGFGLFSLLQAWYRRIDERGAFEVLNRAEGGARD